MREAVKLLLPGRKWLDLAAYPEVHHQQGRTQNTCGVTPGGVK